MKGLTIDVFRGADGVDTTARGPSSRFRSFVMIGLNVPQIHEPTPTLPEIMLSVKDGYPRLTPASLVRARPAFGGNFGWSGDARWTEAMAANGLLGYVGPIKIFDHVIR